jgi:predicted phage terminase large subunit-like protein
VQGGSYYAVGIGGGLTGRGFDLGIIDDPTKDAEEAQSANIREKVWEWYRTVFRTRAAPGAAVIVVMTRWHHDDLVGRLLRLAAEDPQADQWEVLHLKAITDGQALWPERYPIEALEGIRTTIGSLAFASLYQGEPEIEGGNIVRREWWRYYRELPKCTRIIHSWDTAFKGGKTDDWSVCTVWGESETGYHLIDLWRGRVEFPELKRQVVALNDRDRPAAIIVKDAASGQSLIQELRRGTRLPVLPVRPDRDKVRRLTAVTPLIEAGRVLLPERAPWLADYVDEMSAFPNGEHDDQVDSSSQALGWLALQPKRELFIGRAG